jgi:vacuolar-type H+-ATPase subunit H
MKELEQVKRVEKEVSRQIEQARRNSEKRIAGMAAEKEKLVDDRLKAVEAGLEVEKQKARAEAEKEAERVRKSSVAEVGNIEEEARKNFGNAVKLVLRHLTYGRS